MIQINPACRAAPLAGSTSLPEPVTSIAALFKGTSVTRGDAVVVVTSTGIDTELGHITDLVAHAVEIRVNRTLAAGRDRHQLGIERTGAHCPVTAAVSTGRKIVVAGAGDRNGGIRHDPVDELVSGGPPAQRHDLGVGPEGSEIAGVATTDGAQADDQGSHERDSPS